MHINTALSHLFVRFGDVFIFILLLELTAQQSKICFVYNIAAREVSATVQQLLLCSTTDKIMDWNPTTASRGCLLATAEGTHRLRICYWNNPPRPSRWPLSCSLDGSESSVRYGPSREHLQPQTARCTSPSRVQKRHTRPIKTWSSRYSGRLNQDPRYYEYAVTITEIWWRYRQQAMNIQQSTTQKVEPRQHNALRSPALMRVILHFTDIAKESAVCSTLCSLLHHLAPTVSILTTMQWWYPRTRSCGVLSGRLGSRWLRLRHRWGNYKIIWVARMAHSNVTTTDNLSE